MDQRYWRYFISLERQHSLTTFYVEPAKENFCTFSDQFTALLLLVGSEVDVVAKALCRQLDPTTKADKIFEYRSVILGKFPQLPEIEIRMPRFGLAFQPWLQWHDPDPSSPDWWRSYNNVKHNRVLNRRYANLWMVLNALSGLMALNLYFYQEYRSQKGLLNPHPEVLEYNLPAYLVSAIEEKPLPGF